MAELPTHISNGLTKCEHLRREGVTGLVWTTAASEALSRMRLKALRTLDSSTAVPMTFRNAFPWDELPRYLLRDRDHAFDHVKTIGIQEVLTAVGSPWQNAYVERFIGSVRRECLDQVIVLTAAGLRRVLNEYVTYYSRTRTHLSLNKDAPVPRPITPPTAGRVIAIPQVGGLPHRYERRAA